nr:MAG TPA: Glycine rich protein family [Caudoviricetes sp.]
MKLIKKILAVCLMIGGIFFIPSCVSAYHGQEEALAKAILEVRTKLQIAENNLNNIRHLGNIENTPEYKAYLLAKLEYDDLLYFRYLVQLNDMDLNK